eukprot:COSAG03_NODE_21201_length_307_cov_1.043269_2_plen_59_part_01
MYIIMYDTERVRAVEAVVSPRIHQHILRKLPFAFHVRGWTDHPKHFGFIVVSFRRSWPH